VVAPVVAPVLGRGLLVDELGGMDRSFPAGFGGVNDPEPPVSPCCWLLGLISGCWLEDFLLPLLLDDLFFLSSESADVPRRAKSKHAKAAAATNVRSFEKHMGDLPFEGYYQTAP
jgi:hypothetical protein